LPCSYLGVEDVKNALDQAVGIHVVDLDLSSNGLDVDAVPLLGATFSRLRALRLKYNQLTDLPVTALRQLAHLEVLELDGNQISVLEEAALAALPGSLRRLSLSSNGMARLPDGIGVSACRALTHLNLSTNPLTALPDSLGSCPALSHLDVSSCRLMALPASLAGAGSLKRLFCQVGANPASPAPVPLIGPGTDIRTGEGAGPDPAPVPPPRAPPPPAPE
jgi:Leucine-rich repeat (LRR) protein